MGKQPYQTFVVELTAIMRSINTDKEDARDTITSDLLDPSSAFSRYEDGTPEVIALDTPPTSVDSAAIATPADEPVALVVEPSKTSNKYYDDVVKAALEYLKKIDQYEDFVKELTSAPTTLQENFQGFIDALPSRAVFEQSRQAFMANLSDNPEPHVELFIQSLKKNDKRLAYMPYFNIPYIFGKFCSLADDTMIKTVYGIINEDGTTAAKVGIIKLLGEILLKRATLGQELREIEGTPNAKRTDTASRFSETATQLLALGILESTLQAEIAALSPFESHAISESDDDTRQPLPAEVSKFVSGLMLESRSLEEESAIKSRILNDLYPFVESHRKIPDEQKKN